MGTRRLAHGQRSRSFFKYFSLARYVSTEACHEVPRIQARALGWGKAFRHTCLPSQGKAALLSLKRLPERGLPFRYNLKANGVNLLISSWVLKVSESTWQCILGQRNNGWNQPPPHPQFWKHKGQLQVTALPCLSWNSLGFPVSRNIEK